MRVTSEYDEPSLSMSPTATCGNPRALLEIRRGAARHRLRPVVGPMYLIGASSECDLVLADPQFPEFHAYILITAERVLLRRLGVGPEITVDGRPVEAVELLDGDRLRTGPYEFLLHIGTSPDGPAGKDAIAGHKPHAVRAPHFQQQSPLEQVRALLTDVRARLSQTTSSCANATVRRDAA